MKIKFISMIIIICSLLVFSSCKRYMFYAEIYISNVGDIAVRAYVDDDMSIVDPGEIVVWELSWEGDDLLQVNLYVETIAFEDYDEKIIVIGDGEEYTWEVGWEFVNPRKKLKKVKNYARGISND